MHLLSIALCNDFELPMEWHFAITSWECSFVSALLHYRMHPHLCNVIRPSYVAFDSNGHICQYHLVNVNQGSTKTT